MISKIAPLDIGFRIEEPDVLITWGISVEELLRAFTDRGLSKPRRVAAGYYTCACRILGGLRAQIGFHFDPQTDGGVLRELEVFDNGEREIGASYALFQEKLAQKFGEPSVKKPGSLGQAMPSCEWHLGSISVMHYVVDRFGPEEHVRIRKSRSSGWLNVRVILAILISLAVLILFSWFAEGR